MANRIFLAIKDYCRELNMDYNAPIGEAWIEVYHQRAEPGYMQMAESSRPQTEFLKGH